MRLVSWNCRGFWNPLKFEAFKDLLKIESPKIVMLQETKIEGETLLEIRKLKWKKNAGKDISVRGSSGGLATLWLEEKVYLEISFETQPWIFTEVRHSSRKLIFSLFNLYVPILFSEKKECWKTLSDFLEIYSPMKLIVVRDLNIVLEPK